MPDRRSPTGFFYSGVTVDDRGIDVPGLIRPSGPQTNLRLGWMKPQPRATPGEAMDERVPG